MTFIIYLLLGAVAGLASGLFGIGGGIVVVPVLFYSFTLLGFPEALIMQMALGTSLATIIVTSFFASKAHNKRGNLQWPLLRIMVPGLLIGSVLGGVVAHHLPADLLRIAFAVFLLFIALQMWFELKPGTAETIPARWIMSLITLLIGTISALFGIGGGSLVVPLLTRCRLPIRYAVGTASATGLAVAVTGSVSFLLTGLRVEQLPDWSLGYIYLPAFLGIVLTSMHFARMGAALVSKLSPMVLKRCFALFLSLVAVKLLLG